MILFRSTISFYFSDIHSIGFWEFDIETPTKFFIYLLEKV